MSIKYLTILNSYKQKLGEKRIKRFKIYRISKVMITKLVGENRRNKGRHKLELSGKQSKFDRGLTELSTQNINFKKDHMISF